MQRPPAFLRQIAAILLGGLLGLGGLETPQTVFAETGLQQVVGTKVRLQPPPDFLPAGRFAGFVQAATHASILITELPAPYAEISKGLQNPEEMQKRGLTLLENQPVKIDRQDALLMKIQQTAQGLTYWKWILVLGNGSETVLITATFLKEQATDLSEPLKQSLLTTRWDPLQSKPQATIQGYHLTEYRDLKLALELQVGTRLYYKNGILPNGSAELKEPLLVVAPSISPQPVADPEAFAQKRLLQTETVQNIRIQTTQPVTIDGLAGYAITAEAQDRMTQTPLTFYQVILFEADHNYYIFQGFVATEGAGDYLPVFKQMIASFKR